MKTKTQHDFLLETKEGLILIEAKVQKSLFNRLEGVDTLDMGLDVLAKALASLFAYPDLAGEETPRIDDVLAYLVAKGHASRDSVQHAKAVIDYIKRAMYRDGLMEEEIKTLGEKQAALHRALQTLVRSVEAAGGDTSNV